MKLSCAVIVHYADGVILVRDKGKRKWRLPERPITDVEDVVLCARRCTLLQTGYRANHLRLFKIQTQARTPKKAAFMRFIFGGEIAPGALQNPEVEAEAFSPTELLELAKKGDFTDLVLIELLHKYQAMAATPENPDPFAIFTF